MLLFLQKPLDLIFPKTCVHCQKHGDFLCESCYQQIEFFAVNSEPGLDELYLDKTLIMGPFKTPLKQLIHTLKYNSVRAIGSYLGSMISRHMVLPDLDCLSFTPIAHGRRCQRGFNQSQLIATSLAKRINKPCCQLLIKTKSTKHQAQLLRQERLNNLKNCFALNTKRTLSSTGHESVLLVDDVITTGTTLNQCAKLLKKAGWKKVVGLAVAGRG